MPDPRAVRLKEIAALAVKAERLAGVPAASTVAQWAVESQWGASPVGHANYFGIKRADRHKLSVSVPTHEWWHQEVIDLWNQHNPNNPAISTGRSDAQKRLEVTVNQVFADYGSLAESVDDYIWLIVHGNPYAATWASYRKTFNIMDFVKGVAAVYSTSAQYGDLVVKIAFQTNVTNAIAAARQAPAS